MKKPGMTVHAYNSTSEGMEMRWVDPESSLATQGSLHMPRSTLPQLSSIHRPHNTYTH